MDSSFSETKLLYFSEIYNNFKYIIKLNRIISLPNKTSKQPNNITKIKNPKKR